METRIESRSVVRGPIRMAMNAGLAILLLFGGLTASAAPLDDDSEATKKDRRKAKAELKRALSEKDETAIAYWIEALAVERTPEVLRQVLAVGVHYPTDPVAEIVRKILSGSRDSDAVEFFAKELARAKDVRRALLIVEALGFIDRPSAIDPLITALQKNRSAVLTIPILRALREKRDARVVDALVEFFGKVDTNQDKVWAELRVSLLTLTGENYTSHTDWVNWWIVSRDNWKPGRVVDKNKAKTRVFRPKSGDTLDLPIVFGHEISSKRVVFVIDTSSSMEEPFRPDARESGSTSEGPTRLEAAKKEMIKAILALRKDVQFGLIAYNKQVYSWPKKNNLIRATEKNKRKAIKFVQGWGTDSTTSTGPALVTALDVEEVDTVVLLSDGSPTSPEDGTLVPVEPILLEIQRLNRFKGVTIHTLGFDGAKISFMKALAAQNDGLYSPIR